MQWDINEIGSPHYVFEEPASPVDSPIQVGQHITLNLGDSEYRVRVTKTEPTGQYCGQIEVISENGSPVIKSKELNRGDDVTFNEANIFFVYRGASS